MATPLLAAGALLGVHPSQICAVQSHLVPIPDSYTMDVVLGAKRLSERLRSGIT
uniref:Uncharacterized protein n=1 Tax=Physcomitrium patens TaxID=3218 RepID=A0A2K1KLZ0_PHYPA|nr:hypothetical protein PHYPA_005685 [Physcomitrium patens]